MAHSRKIRIAHNLYLYVQEGDVWTFHKCDTYKGCNSPLTQVGTITRDAGQTFLDNFIAMVEGNTAWRMHQKSIQSDPTSIKLGAKDFDKLLTRCEEDAQGNPRLHRLFEEPAAVHLALRGGENCPECEGKPCANAACPLLLKPMAVVK